jgi:hypothetical protein
MESLPLLLGVAHEGYFPARKRVVLRPRFDVCAEEPRPVDDYDDRDWDRDRDRDRDRDKGAQDGEAEFLNEDGGKNLMVEDEYNLVESDTMNLNSEKVKEALAVALGGLIIDVTQSEKKGDEIGENVSVGDESPASDETKTVGETAALGFSLRTLEEKNNSTTAPGSGWGLVDADGSDEGFGVVGLEMGAVDHSGVRVTGEGDLKSNEVKNKAQINIENESKINSVANDRMGDVRLVESGIREGSDVVETGPSHGGTKKVL